MMSPPPTLNHQYISLLLILTFAICLKFTESVYTSITSLDKYGSSPQIQNAKLASSLHGVPTIVAIADNSNTNTTNNNIYNNNTVIVVSLEKKTPGVIKNTHRDKIHIIAQEEGESIIALVGSGLKADITFITNLLRKNACQIWERYDVIPNIDRVAFNVGQIMLGFMGYDLEDEIADGVPHILSSDEGGGDSDNSISIGRPLAAEIVIIHTSIDTGVDMKVVDPSGMVSESIFVRALGRGNDKANHELQKRWRRNMTCVQVEELCVDILRDVAISEGIILEKGNVHDCIICERLTRSGISLKRIPFHVMI